MSFCGFVSDFPLLLFSLTLSSSSFFLLLLTVSCLCLYCDLLWHSQHISVAAIKIAQKIIINIVGYNKKKKKLFRFIFNARCISSHFAFHISRPVTTADAVRCWLMIYANKNGDSSDMRAYTYLRSICVYFVVKSWTGDTKTASTGAEQLRLDNTLYPVRLCANL